MFNSFHAQPLIRKMMKPQLDIPTNTNKSYSEVLTLSQRGEYQHYHRQTQQLNEISIQKLQFIPSKESFRNNPHSLFLTKEQEEVRSNSKSNFEETKYLQKINISNVEQKIQLTDLPKFKIVSNSAFRNNTISERINRRQSPTQELNFSYPKQGYRKMIICNALSFDTEQLQYKLLYIPDLNQPFEQFGKFIQYLKQIEKIKSTKRLYFFLKDGTKILSHLDIPPQNKTLIYSYNSVNKQFSSLELDLTEQKLKSNVMLNRIKKFTQHNSDQIQSVIQNLGLSYNDQSTSKGLKSQLKQIENKGKIPLQTKFNKNNNLLKKYQHDRHFSECLDSNSKKIQMKQQIYEDFETQYCKIINKNKYQQINLLISFLSKKIQQIYHSFYTEQFTIKKQNKYEIVIKQYENEIKKINYDKNFDDLNKIINDEENDNEIQPNNNMINQQINKVAELLQPILDKFLNSEKQKQQYNDIELIQQNQNLQNIKNNFIKNNVKIRNSKRFSLFQLQKINRELFVQNIPKLLNQTHFSRYELHNAYILYCTLQQITSQKYEQYNVNDGIDYQTYRRGIFQIFFQNEFLAQEIFNRIDCNQSGFLNWDEFLRLMMSIRAKSIVEKIDLFIEISDQDGNGQLSYDEIFKLSKLCISHYFKEDNGNFLDVLCEYYTRLIFQIVNKNIDEEIQFSEIKQAIIENKENSDLLLMFCGADI